MLEPEAAAGATAAHITWTLPQAVAVVTVARERLIRTLSRRGGLPLEEASCVVLHNGVPFYKCDVCKVRVPLALGRGALVEHFLSYNTCGGKARKSMHVSSVISLLNCIPSASTDRISRIIEAAKAQVKEDDAGVKKTVMGSHVAACVPCCSTMMMAQVTTPALCGTASCDGMVCAWGPGSRSG